ncbi:hypothetical protein llap_15328 [Limosa lapponica baueri]|uniref:Adhesion G protein-coupled receptor F5 n=1 Tax=Limosa lapponica baueri TaxID=1758121 RepID=A0A2I0TKP4_LIMLA|nr:hypothetical protein llap_15328 [Limosa lapponica baueri]
MGFDYTNRRGQYPVEVSLEMNLSENHLWLYSKAPGQNAIPNYCRSPLPISTGHSMLPDITGLKLPSIHRIRMITFDLPPVEYIVDIEISLMNSSFLDPVKNYLQNLSLPVSTNISNVEMKVSNISITTDGYAWPDEACGDLITCPSASLAPNQACSYMKSVLFQGHYCKSQTKDPCGMGEPIEMQMSVRLDIDFCDELSNSSSELYKKYKVDLEKAFNASYRCLPGFVSAAVSGFSSGSVFVNYVVKAGAASFEQIASANKISPQFLDSFYRLNQDTFTTKMTNQTNFTVSPEDIFEGDTVRLICEINSTSENVTWYHHGQIISPHLLNSTDGKTSMSILEIANITMKNSGSYSCAFTNRNHRFLTLIYNDTKTIAVSPLNITPNVNDITPNVNNITVTCNSPEMQKNSPLLSCCIDKHLPSLIGDWKVNGEINITGVSRLSRNCTEYKLNISESLCPPEKSGTVTTYTCELQTGNGARSSQNIQVRYLRAANVTITSKVNSSVSEGDEFSLTCESDVSNYDRISWKIQSGNNTTEVDCGTCVKNTENPAKSVLTVMKATQKWNDNKVSCLNSPGIGMEGDVLVKPCCESLVNDPERNKILPAYLKDLKKKIEKEKTTINSSANVGAVVTILSMVSTIPAEADKTNIENFLFTVDFVIENSTPEVWEDLNKGEGPKSSSLMQLIENFTLNLQPVNNSIPPVCTNTLQLQGIAVTENSRDYNKTFRSTDNLTVDVFIGNTEVQTLTPNSTIVSVMYSKLGDILPQSRTQYVNGLLITTTVSSNRSQKFNINMIFEKKNLSLKRPQCVFWNFTLNKLGGGWDTQGCAATQGEDDYVSCSCNHLTSFSILMSADIASQKNTEDYITYIGLAISILSLVTCIIIESLVWKYVTNNTTSYMRHVCILNIATSLLIADIWFIVTASINDQNQQMSKGICFVATFFIHLFYLCVFFWMLSLGLILFYRLVFILHNTSKTTQKAVAFCLGYGCPFVIAVITLAVTLPRNSYTRKDICWLNWEDSKALLAFVIPALIIVVMNLFITAVVIIKILRPTIGDRSNKQERKSLFQIGKSVAILTPLLGLTWGFGLATVIKNSHRAFHILFALLNTLQGLFILVFGTLWDKKSSSLILVTPMLAMSYPFSRTFNNLCGKTGKYRVSSSEPSSSSSENTSKSYSLLN